MEGSSEAHSAIADELRGGLDRLFSDRDRPGAVRLVLDAVTSGRIDIPTLYTEVLGPLMTDTGSGWQTGSIRVWEEHFVSAIVRTIIESLYPHVIEAAESVTPADRRVLLTCPPREQHDLGLRMLADRFTLGGWTAHYLGTDTPTQEICLAANALGVELIVLSASTHFNRVLLNKVVDEVSCGAPEVRVMVGGPAFALDRQWPADQLLDPDKLGLPPYGGDRR